VRIFLHFENTLEFFCGLQVLYSNFQKIAEILANVTHEVQENNQNDSKSEFGQQFHHKCVT